MVTGSVINTVYMLKLPKYQIVIWFIIIITMIFFFFKQSANENRDNLGRQ